MKRSSPKDRELAARIDLALLHGKGSVVHVDVHDTMFHTIVGEDEPYVRPSEIRTNMRIALVPVDHAKPLGTVKWYERAWPHSATYYSVPGHERKFMASVQEDHDKPGPQHAKSPSDLGVRVLERFDDLVQRNLEAFARSEDKAEFARRVMDPRAIDDYVNTGIKEYGETVSMVVGKDRSLSVVRPSTVPYYVVVRQEGVNVDKARVDVSFDRDLDLDAMNWAELGTRFEYWEADLAARVRNHYGTPAHFGVPEQIAFDPDRAVDVATVLRMELQSLVPMILKTVMRGIVTAPEFKGTSEALHARTVFDKVSKNEWDAPELAEAMRELSACARGGAPLGGFAKKMGWDNPMPFFTVLEERVVTFPYFVLAAEAKRERELAGVPAPR